MNVPVSPWQGMLSDELGRRSPSVKGVGTKTVRRREETDHKPAAMDEQDHLFTLAGFVLRRRPFDTALQDPIGRYGNGTDSCPSCMFRDHSHNILLLQLWYPNESCVERFQFLLWNLQRKVAPVVQTKFEQQLCHVPEYPHAERALEGPAFSGSVGRPGIVDQPPWELEKGSDEETGQKDSPEGLTVDEGNHGLG